MSKLHKPSCHIQLKYEFRGKECQRLMVFNTRKLRDNVQFGLTKKQREDEGDKVCVGEACQSPKPKEDRKTNCEAFN